MISIKNLKSTKKIALATIGFITIAGLAVYYIGDLKNQNFLYSSDSDYRIVSGEAMFTETFTNVEGLAKNADIIAEAEVISQENNANYERLDVYTVSELRLTKVYKGDVEIDDTVSVLETGGEFDEREVAKYFAGKRGSKVNDDLGEPRITSVGIEGSIPMKEGNKYFVFLTEDKDDVYNIVGSVQGKIKINDENTLVSQVSLEVIEHGNKHNNLFFLQENYSGENISELTNEVERIVNN
ncbi:hypothetical protein ACFVS2_09565 [Brevibacillus sp. NPDC058079]|uniref:hypothetical protein n=1 Tax=Brevibacillus sp. NPDC058079 TaxID=3346330 RepID=UPI0036F12EB3